MVRLSHFLCVLCPPQAVHALTLHSWRKDEQYLLAPYSSIFSPKFTDQEKRLLDEARTNSTRLEELNTKPDCSVTLCEPRAWATFLHSMLPTWDNCRLRDVKTCTYYLHCKLRGETACRKAVAIEFDGSCIASRNNPNLSTSDYKCGRAMSRTECYSKTRADKRYITNSATDNPENVNLYECGWVNHDVADCEHPCDPIHGREQYLERGHMTICSNVFANNVVVCKLKKNVRNIPATEPKEPQSEGSNETRVVSD